MTIVKKWDACFITGDRWCPGYWASTIIAYVLLGSLYVVAIKKLTMKCLFSTKNPPSVRWGLQKLNMGWK